MGIAATSHSRPPSVTGERPRTRSSLPAIDTDTFFKVVKQALDLHMQTEKLPAGIVPFYSHAFPKERLKKTDEPFDGITFKVLASVPAPNLNGGAVSRKPYEFTEPDPDRAGYLRIQHSWHELVTVEFTIWSKSNPTRSLFVNWFHRFILRYANAYKTFEARGADQLQFVGRGEDGFETREEQEIYYGTLTYQVRVQFIDTFTARQTTSLAVAATFGEDQQTILTDLQVAT